MASFLPVVSGDKFTLLYIIIYLKRNAVKAFLSYNLEKREIKLTFVVVYKGLFSFGSSGVRNAQPCLLKDEREKRKAVNDHCPKSCEENFPFPLLLFRLLTAHPRRPPAQALLFCSDPLGEKEEEEFMPPPLPTSLPPSQSS